MPWHGTCEQHADQRARQADPLLSPEAESEIWGLETLTKAGCSSSPSLLAWKKEIQSQDMWIPQGFIVYILMNKLPGMRIDWIEQLPQQERNDFREGFKRAWQ